MSRELIKNVGVELDTLSNFKSIEDLQDTQIFSHLPEGEQNEAYLELANKLSIETDLG